MNLAFTSHEVRITLYARLYYPQFEGKKELFSKFFEKNQLLNPEMRESYHNWFNINKEKEIFQDVYFKIALLEPSRNGWDSTIMKLKRIFNYFPSLVNWRMDNKNVATLSKNYKAKDYWKNSPNLFDDDARNEQFMKAEQLLEWELSWSYKCNFLEAINLSIQNSHIDHSKLVYDNYFKESFCLIVFRY